MKRVTDPRVHRAISVMAERLGQPLTGNELARLAELSPSRFSHLFREETGLSPARYLHALRMTQARVLLASTSLTVKEVMAAVGFTHASHFARSFHRFHGVTARELRRHHAPFRAPSGAPK